MAKRTRETTDSAARPLAIKRSRKEQAASTSTPKATKSVVTSQAANLPKPATITDDKAKDETAKKSLNGAPNTEAATTTTIQIITGSYERVLHGFTAAIPHTLITSHDNPDTTPEDASTPNITFADTFLFNAHASAVRCLALSPLSDDSPKVTLATGSTDERINIYSLSTVPPRVTKHSSKPQLPTLHTTPIASNPKNRELGSLLHHSASITNLYFPTRSKLLSASEDNSITITRSRDWTPLSTIKAPIPKAQGRPSGDTAAPGEVPCGINAFAVHPSLKLMVSVSRGERCMRLWNLVTGKKAGVLNFGRSILEAVNEGRFGSGEGRKVIWDEEGEEFCVGFERGVVVFGMDSKAKGKLVPVPRTKIQEVRYLPVQGEQKKILAVSTEDGRVLFYDTGAFLPVSEKEAEKGEKEEKKEKKSKHDAEAIPACPLLAQLGGPAAGITSRIKDFEILPLPLASSSPATTFIIVTASSDGSTRLWTLSSSDLILSASKEASADGGKKEGYSTAKQVGTPIGTYATGNRITCLKAFVMTGKPEDDDEEEETPNGDAESSSSESDDE
ncbi:WD40 repeat-like protein [Delitschia confertaspora ATCC 74209]|uniref:WD40 repeat-like protein n=1 Tax=Delitschia confertaspora ATCC 74209 TaxID=1513339 RepID=A0A9P4MV54_9PLEO|nr:WD40 repeat-like protein [Delitschia confertaspora ATCC 74209]